MKLLKQIDIEENRQSDRRILIKVPSLRRKHSERCRTNTRLLESQKRQGLPSVSPSLTLKVPLESFVSHTQKSKESSHQFSPGEDFGFTHSSDVSGPSAPQLVGLRDSNLESQNSLPSSLPPALKIQQTISDPLQQHNNDCKPPNVGKIYERSISDVETKEGKPVPESCKALLDIPPTSLHSDLPPKRSTIEVICHYFPVFPFNFERVSHNQEEWQWIYLPRFTIHPLPSTCDRKKDSHNSLFFSNAFIVFCIIWMPNHRSWLLQTEWINWWWTLCTSV